MSGRRAPHAQPVLAALALLAALVVLAQLGAACATEPPAPECEGLSYDTFAAPFLANWCRGCHGAQLAPEQRQRAPIDVNFETHADLVRWTPRLWVRVIQTNTMPPAGGPNTTERELLRRYLTCGAPR